MGNCCVTSLTFISAVAIPTLSLLGVFAYLDFDTFKIEKIEKSNIYMTFFGAAFIHFLILLVFILLGCMKKKPSINVQLEAINSSILEEETKPYKIEPQLTEKEEEIISTLRPIDFPRDNSTGNLNAINNSLKDSNNNLIDNN